jgi:uncharacterized protein (DUF2147 family)
MMGAFLFTPFASAADNEDVTITVTPSGATLDIDVNGTSPSYDIGSVSLGSSGNTTATYFTVYNNGTVDADTVTATASVDTGTNPWTIVAFGSYTGKDNCAVNVTTDTWDGSGDTNLNGETTILDALAQSSSETFGVKVWVPESVTGGSQEQTITINIAGTAL